jgi:hypothetical protein
VKHNGVDVGPRVGIRQTPAGWVSVVDVAPTPRQKAPQTRLPRHTTPHTTEARAMISAGVKRHWDRRRTHAKRVGGLSATDILQQARDWVP